jgi:phosphotriesterase-related protein
MIMTVTGQVDPASISAMVPHEHVVHTFGAPATVAPAYDREHVMRIALPALVRLRGTGCQALAECTTEYFGRAPELLRSLSERSGVLILTNTGYYGAAKDRYVPEHAFAESADQIAARWVAEWENGIGGTGIRPGFIKVGVDSPGPLSEIDAKLVRAAAIAHRMTGLVMAVHSPGDGTLADAELAILEEEGVAPSAWIWVHADSVADVPRIVEAARRGAWIELDAVRPENLDARISLLQRLKAEGVLGRVLLSHDESSYAADRSEPAQVHTTVFTHLVPRLLDSGFTQTEAQAMIGANPREAFTVAKRLR